ncbi:MAG TPA: cytochrome c oxidase subunit II [Gaiellales bacterium]|nr:cytochrome c oxidase subunit II [Gaiellales bacterium]
MRSPSYLKVLALALALGTAGSIFCWLTLKDWFPVQAATQAQRHDQIYLVVLIVSSYIFAIIVATLGYSIWSFRAKPGDDSDGPPIHGHTGLEIVWTAIPVAIVVGLAIYAGVIVVQDEALSRHYNVVDVTGQQFWWRFQYPGHTFTSGYVEVPVNEDVQFRITSVPHDVIHEFYIPAFREGEDAVPGITTFLEAHPTRLGTYTVVCAELCGIGHSQMRTIIRVVTRPQYERWLAAMQSAVKAPAATASGATGGAAGPTALLTLAKGGA